MPPKKNTKTKYEDEDDDIYGNDKNVNEEENEDDNKDDDDNDDKDKNEDDDDDDAEDDDAEDVNEEENEDDNKDDDDDVEEEEDGEGEGEGGDYLENIEGGAKGEDEENGDDDDNESDDKYKKINKYINKDELLKYHTECIVQNYDEIRSMSDIQMKSAHVTIPLLTKYERARIIGMRTVQLNNGADPLVEVPDTLLDNTIIAEKELMAKKIPFILCRPLPNGSKEYWKLEDLEIL